MDPDLQIRGGPGDPEPELTRGWGVVSKKFFCPSSGLSLVYKQVGGGGVGLSPTEDDSPGTLPIGQVS